MPTTLLDISEDMIALDDLLTDSGGDITSPEVESAIDQWMQELDQNLQNKADGYCALIQEMRSRAEARKAEAKRLADRARIDAHNARFLKERLQYVFERHGIKRLETKRFKISVAKNGGKLPMTIYDESQIPKDKQIVITVPDQDAIRHALDADETVPGARLEERGSHLQIR
jgi:hypothetical protein